MDILITKTRTRCDGGKLKRQSYDDRRAYPPAVKIELTRGRKRNKIRLASQEISNSQKKPMDL